MIMLNWNSMMKPFKRLPIKPSKEKQELVDFALIIEETMMDVMFGNSKSRRMSNLSELQKEAVDGTEKPILETA